MDPLPPTDPGSANELLPLVYEELRRLAARKLAREAPGQTLQPTALVHEAYLRLVKGDNPQPWNSRGHFFGAAAEAMRRILVERARRKQRQREHAPIENVDLEAELVAIEPPHEDVLALEEALELLAKEDPRAAEIVKLRLYAGLSVDEVAEVLDLSRATAYRDWNYAQTWLREKLEGDDPTGPISS